MNFKYMPELEWKYSYLIALFIYYFHNRWYVFVYESERMDR